jgi:hypothetical protein
MSEANMYVYCSRCGCKYQNKDENIKEYFGYNRLGERYKTCVKCREKRRVIGKRHYDNNREEILEQQKEYRETHKEQKKEYATNYYHENKEYFKQKGIKYRERQLEKQVPNDTKCCTRCYKQKPLTDYGEYKGTVKIDDKWVEGIIPYRSCSDCRNRDKVRRAITV